MAIIYSYPLNDDIKPLDELVGTTEKNINGQLKTVTRNFLLQDLAEFFIVDGGLQKEIILTTNDISGPATLDQVTGILNIPRYDENTIASAALTKVNDTNVALTLGGSPSNALLQEVSLTLGWIGTLADSRITSSSNWNTAYNNRITSLTTIGTSGEATLVDNTLNIPAIGIVSATQSGIVNNTSLQELGGVDKTINGVRVGRGNISAAVSENTAVGYQALQSVTHATGFEGWYNSAFGDSALKALTTGYANNAFGEWALIACTTGTFNTAVGGSTLSTLTTGTQNLAIGVNALRYSLSGNKNTAVGTGALYRNTGSFNTAIGNLAGGAVTSSGSNNILIGFQAGSNISSGTNNLLIENITNPSITSGSFNIILNPKQKSGVTTGSYNTIIGAFDGTFPTGMANNVIVADGQGNIRFRTTETGLTTVPSQTNALIIADTTGKAVVTKEYVESIAGGQNLQQVTDLGATTTKGITINTVNANGLNINTSGSDTTKSPLVITSTISDATTFKSLSYNGVLGNYFYSDTGDCVSLQTDDTFGIGLNVTSTGIGISAYSIYFPVMELFQALNNKGLIINSGTSSTGNFIELAKNSVNKLTVNQAGELTATKLIKEGGTSSQLLAANGDSITAGTNITISGGTISSTGGGGGGSIPHATASGTDTYTVTVSGITSYADGDAYLIRFTNGNTTVCTLNINSLGAIPLYRNNDGPLIGGDIQNSGEMLCVYNSTVNTFQCIGTSPNSIISYVTNDDSVTITKGQAVYAFSGQGDRVTVKRAFNTSDSTSAQTIGIVMSTSIGVNQKGFIMMQGLLDNLSTLPATTYADGSPVYLGATAGSITNIKPYAPNHLVYLGIVTTASNGNAGRMYVRVQNGYELDELHNVQAQTPTLKDTLYYDNTVSPAQWKTASISSILGFTPANDSDVVHLTGNETIAGLKTFTSDLTATKYLYSGGSIFPEFGSTFYINGDTRTHYFGGGTSNVQNNLEVSNGTLKIGLQTASTVASFDANKNVVSLPLATYPSLTELSYAKGVTSSIQTQLDGKQPINANLTSISTLSTTSGVSVVKVYNGSYFLDSTTPTQSAYTMLANNTASTAVPTEKVFKDIAEQTNLSTASTISWTGTAPTNATSLNYKWNQVGSLVTVRFNLTYGTTGTANTQLSISLPSDMPTPQTITGFTSASEVIGYGAGQFGGAKTLAAAYSTGAVLRRNSTNTGYEFVIARSSANATTAWLIIQYFA